VTGLSKALYAEPGYLLYQRNGTLYAHSFDAEALAVRGDPVRIAGEVPFGDISGQAAFSVSGNGTLVFRSGEAAAPTVQFVWYSRTGMQLGKAGEPGPYDRAFKLSPDGRQIAVTINGDIWLMDWERGVTQRFTFDPSLESDLAWSPDGLRIAFTSRRSGAGDIFVQNSSGLGQETALIEAPGADYVEDWSADGRHLVYGNSIDRDLYVRSMEGEAMPFPIVQSPFQHDEAHFSPDSRWLSYDSDESGAWQVYVVSFPSANQKRQISTNGGVAARWRGDGKELYYLAPNGALMAVDVQAGERFDSGVPRVLFDTGITPEPNLDQYTASQDGQRFLFRKPLAEAEPTPITVVINWPRGLEHR
jgi:hypothetical protein